MKPTVESVLAQGDAMATAIERAVPTRPSPTQPHLVELFGMAQLWRNYALVTRAELRRATPENPKRKGRK